MANQTGFTEKIGYRDNLTVAHQRQDLTNLRRVLEELGATQVEVQEHSEGYTIRGSNGPRADTQRMQQAIGERRKPTRRIF